MDSTYQLASRLKLDFKCGFYDSWISRKKYSLVEDLTLLAGSLIFLVDFNLTIEKLWNDPD